MHKVRAVALRSYNAVDTEWDLHDSAVWSTTVPLKLHLRSGNGHDRSIDAVLSSGVRGDVSVISQRQQ